MLIQGSAGFVPGALAEIEVDAVFLGTGGSTDIIEGAPIGLSR